MKIVQVDLFEYQLAYTRGHFVMSHGRTQTHETSLVVRITTDEGLVGWGESCPHGGTYLPAFFEGEKAAVAVLSEAILGLDPTQPSVIQAAMTNTLIGSTPAKSAIDVACWDILGKAADMPIAELLGGRHNAQIRVFEGVTLDTPEAMGRFVEQRLEEGWLDFQLKIGDDPYEDARRLEAVLSVTDSSNTVIADANGGWNLQNAIIAVREMKSFRSAYIEQPRVSMQDCAEVRRRTDLPLIIDECVKNVDDLVIGKTTVFPGGVNIKPGRLGGITPARLLRDTATALGLRVTIDDTWGGSIVTTTNSHLAASTATDALLTTSFFSEWTTPHVANGPVKGPDGLSAAPTGPGLGIEVDETLLGSPAFTIS